ncbi:hypothetical protein [Brevundimonas sp.]|uniref:hypothetical protein n=1 Tax=Brevundimonas sp. TaxID=1871086 RepID=UPI001E06E9B0|nr:hypothetical protein [Brevundimonas sp.]MBL0948013.1 hypothetical protein [Brevundimonas sp.]
MIRALSLAAALALLPASMAMAQSSEPESAEAVLEAAAEAFESRMDEFADRAEAIAEDDSLTEDQKEAAVMALWAEYQPDVMTFTQTVSGSVSGIVAEALAEVDIEAVVAEALADVDIEAVVAEAVAVGQGVMTNGAWASNDPEHQATYGLMADYAVGMAMDELDAGFGDEVEADPEH